MSDSKDYSFPSTPTREQLTAARAALAAQQKAGNYLCGCFTALCRDPFFSGLVSHWQTYHPNSLAILGNAQAHRLDLYPRPGAGMEAECNNGHRADLS